MNPPNDDEEHSTVTDVHTDFPIDAASLPQPPSTNKSTDQLMTRVSDLEIALQETENAKAELEANFVAERARLEARRKEELRRWTTGKSTRDFTSPSRTPVDNMLAIYMHINNVSDLNEDQDSFRSKFMIKVTWVQDLTKEEEKKLELSGDLWAPYVFDPRELLRFSNAIDVIQFKKQSLNVSHWRVPKPKHNAPDKHRKVVLEWSAFVSSNFNHHFELDDFPYDNQDLEIRIDFSKIDSIRLYDDKTDNVNSSFYDKNNVIHDEYVFRDVEEYEPDDKESSSRKLNAKTNWIKVNPGKKAKTFHQIKYIVPIKRKSNFNEIMEIIIPVTVISLLAFGYSVYPPYEAGARLGVGMSITLVLATYMSTYLGRFTQKGGNLISRHMTFSFVLICTETILNMILSFIICDGYCDDIELAMSVDNFTIRRIDVILTSLFLLFWIVENVYVYSTLVYMKQRNTVEKHDDDGERDDEEIPFIEKGKLQNEK